MKFYPIWFIYIYILEANFCNKEKNIVLSRHSWKLTKQECQAGSPGREQMELETEQC